MKIGIVQYSPEWENVTDNIITLEKIIRENRGDEEVLILPEMTLTGFTMESEKFAEEEDGISLSFFIDLAVKYKKHILAGYIEKFGESIYNALIHIDDMGLIHARYRKIHPYSPAGESKAYTRGRNPVATNIDKVKVGLSVCYDLRFPELYRNYGKSYNEIMVNIANWPDKRIAHWEALLKARAIENECFMIGVNRTGNDPFNNYPGNSAVFGPSGETILVADDKEGFFTADLDMNRVKETREKLPFLEDIKMI